MKYTGIFFSKSLPHKYEYSYLAFSKHKEWTHLFKL